LLYQGAALDARRCQDSGVEYAELSPAGVPSAGTVTVTFDGQSFTYVLTEGDF
jgi:hypothetical protein